MNLTLVILGLTATNGWHGFHSTNGQHYVPSNGCMVAQFSATITNGVWQLQSKPTNVTARSWQRFGALMTSTNQTLVTAIPDAPRYYRLQQQ